MEGGYFLDNKVSNGALYLKKVFEYLWDISDTPRALIGQYAPSAGKRAHWKTSVCFDGILGTFLHFLTIDWNRSLSLLKILDFGENITLTKQIIEKNMISNQNNNFYAYLERI